MTWKVYFFIFRSLGWYCNVCDCNIRDVLLMINESGDKSSVLLKKEAVSKPVV